MKLQYLLRMETSSLLPLFNWSLFNSTGQSFECFLCPFVCVGFFQKEELTKNVWLGTDNLCYPSVWFHCRIMLICITFCYFLADSSRHSRLIDWSQLPGRLLPQGWCSRCGPTDQFLLAEVVYNSPSFCPDHHVLGE